MKNTEYNKRIINNQNHININIRDNNVNYWNNKVNGKHICKIQYDTYTYTKYG